MTDTEKQYDVWTRKKIYGKKYKKMTQYMPQDWVMDNIDNIDDVDDVDNFDNVDNVLNTVLTR